MRHGGRILVDQLVVEGVERVFCVPGESYLAALDGLFDRQSNIETIVCRQEGGAAMMAEAHGKLRGEPGVCFVTRGPGAMNAAIGVHIAEQDQTPMVLVVGMPATTNQDREAFQEIDVKAIFGALAKWAGVIGATRRIPEYVSRAFHIARSGRPGPVVLGLPEDILSSRAEVGEVPRARPARAAVDPADIALLGVTLEKAERPLMIVGGPGWSNDVRERLEAFAGAADLPVAAAFRCQDYFDNRHDCYIGHAAIGIDPALAKRIREADVVIAVGTRLDEMTTGGWQLLEAPKSRQFLVQVHPGSDEIGNVYRADLAINATADNFSTALGELALAGEAAWRTWRREARADYEAFLVPRLTPSKVKLEQVVATLSQMLPEDAVLTNGAGNYTGWLHRYHTYRTFRSQLAPVSGAMGYGLPAAIAAKLAHPDRTVVAFAGDGCFLMNGQEMATVIQYGLAIVIIVVNNAMYGTIRMHQETKYPRRVMATSLANPDFAAMARSFGGFGEVVERTIDFRPAMQRALDAATLALIELRVSGDAITPSRTIEDIRDLAGDV